MSAIVNLAKLREEDMLKLLGKMNKRDGGGDRQDGDSDSDSDSDSDNDNDDNDDNDDNYGLNERRYRRESFRRRPDSHPQQGFWSLREDVYGDGHRPRPPPHTWQPTKRLFHPQHLSTFTKHLSSSSGIVSKPKKQTPSRVGYDHV